MIVILMIRIFRCRGGRTRGFIRLLRKQLMQHSITKPEAPVDLGVARYEEVSFS